MKVGPLTAAELKKRVMCIEEDILKIKDSLLIIAEAVKRNTLEQKKDKEK